MFVTALRLAPNIERPLMELQDRLFRSCGLLSTRLFPPLIPLACFELRTAADESGHRRRLVTLLDGVRRSLPLELQGYADAPVRKDAPTTHDVSLQVRIRNYHAFLELLLREMGEFVCIADQRDAPRIVLARENPSSFSNDRTAELQYCLDGTSLPALPVTAAFWLWAAEVIPGPDVTDWWISAQWQELFSRRVTIVNA